MKSLTLSVLTILGTLLFAGPARAGSATWLLNPGSGDWDVATNWTPATFPNGSADIATFDLSNTTNVSTSLPFTDVDRIVFTSTASAFTITASQGFKFLRFDGVGITNNSAVTQNFVSDAGAGGQGAIAFVNSSSAGSNVTFTTNGGGSMQGGGFVQFSGNSNAGSAMFINKGGTAADSFSGGFTQFEDTSSAMNGTFINQPGAVAGAPGGAVSFDTSATAGGGNFTNQGGIVSGGLGGSILFHTTTPTAGGAVFNNDGGTVSGAFGGTITFRDSSTAGDAIFQNHGGTASGAFGGSVAFFDAATTDVGIFNDDGGAASGASGSSVTFNDTSNAGGAIFNSNGGSVGGALGSSLTFNDSSSAGTSIINTIGGPVSGAFGATTTFNDNSTAAGSIINNLEPEAVGAIEAETVFNDSSTAGSATINNNGNFVNSGNPGGGTVFHDTSTAGTAKIDNFGASVAGGQGGFLQFTDMASADHATITSHGGTIADASGATVQFFDSSTADHASITINGGEADAAGAASLTFSNSATAANATITTNGATADNAFGGVTDFRDNSHAGSANITVNGTSNTNAGSGFLSFHDSSSAENAIITLNPPSGVGTAPGGVVFLDSSTAAGSTLTANGATNGGGGGSIAFLGDSLGGSAAVTLNGNSTLEIANHNGGVEIGSLAGQGMVILGDNTLTDGNLNTDTTFSGVLQDGGGSQGALTKVGTGNLTLAGANTLHGSVTVNAGTLTVANLFALGNGDTVVNGGVLQTDGHRSFAVGNNYIQGSGGTLVMGIGKFFGLVSSDTMLTDGSATLDGTLVLKNINNAKFLPGDQATIIGTNTGVIGQFATVDTSAFTGLIQPTVVYDPPGNPFNVDVVFELAANFHSVALTPNQKTVAHVIDTVVGDPRADELIAFLGNEPLGLLPNDFDLIAPEEYAAIYEMGFSQANLTNANLQHRMDDIRAGSTGFCSNGYQAHTTSTYGKDSKDGPAPTNVVALPPADSRWGVFVNGSGDFISTKDDDFNARGYDITTGSFTLGADYRVCRNFAIGIDGGYNGSSADLVNGGQIDMNGGNVGAYATVFGFQFLGASVHVDGAIGGAWNSYDTHRTGLEGAEVRGSTNSSQFNAMLAYGADRFFGCFLFGTWSTIQYTDVHIDGFTESGSIAPLHIDNQDNDSFIGTSGVRLAYDWHASGAIIRPEVRAAWLYESNETAYPISARLASGAGNDFTVHGPKVGRDAALVDAGVSVIWNNHISTFVYYDGILGRDNYNNNSVTGGVRFGF